MKSEKTLDFPWNAPKFKGQLAGTKWTLCIGAGVSKFIVPDWEELTLSLIQSSFNDSFLKEDIEKIRYKTSWGYESLLQTVLNFLTINSNSSVEDYNKLLEKIIYRDILAKAEKYGVSMGLKRVLNKVDHITQKDLKLVHRLFLEEYSGTTSFKLAEVMSLGRSDRMPESIITFNADTIFHTMMSVLTKAKYLEDNGSYQPKPEKFYRIYRPLIENPKDSIPIYHIHGAITPETNRNRDSRDRLIFLESSYLGMTKSNVNWSENVFLNSATTTRLILVGISLSDQNMRRWLAWSSAQINSEINAESGEKIRSTPHIWLTTKPKSGNIELQMDFIRNSVIHLGVKVCWLDDWSQADQAVKHLTGI